MLLSVKKKTKQRCGEEQPGQLVKGSFGWCDQGSLSEKMASRCEHRKELVVENEGEDYHVRE